jgi:hypothetical protein
MPLKFILITELYLNTLIIKIYIIFNNYLILYTFN